MAGALTRGSPSLIVGTPGRTNDLLELNNPPVSGPGECPTW